MKPQDVFPAYLEHGQRVVELVKPYINSANLATAAGKPFFMFETNTASCGGFFGVSDTYGAALWAMDYGFQMAYANFTHAMLHVGGQNAFYNVCSWSVLPCSYGLITMCSPSLPLLPTSLLSINGQSAPSTILQLSLPRLLERPTHHVSLTWEVMVAMSLRLPMRSTRRMSSPRLRYSTMSTTNLAKMTCK